MFHSIVTLLVVGFAIAIQIISSQDISGVFLVDSCECNSSTQTCDIQGPYSFNQQRLSSSILVNYGSQQVGIGTLKQNRLDLYVNQNRCKGTWNEKNRVAELVCQHSARVACATHLRCITGPCLNSTLQTRQATSKASTATTKTILFIVGILLILV